MYCIDIIIIIIVAIAPIVKTDFPDDVLKRHNELRAVHKSPSLSLNIELNEKAEMLAKQAAVDGKFPKDISGANTEMICSSFKRTFDDGVQVSDQWYHEVCNKNFNFDRPTTDSSFVRMIRKDTKFIGIGKANTENTEQPCTFIVALYDPKESKGSAFLERGDFKDSICKNKRRKRRRRSIYYRFPARFVIDPITGQTRSVTPIAKSKDATFLNEESAYNYGDSDKEEREVGYLTNPEKALQYVEDGNFRKPAETVKRSRFISKQKALKRDFAPTSPMALSAIALEAHNILRKIHGSPNMKVNNELAMTAQEVAESNARLGELKHSANLKDSGENLAYSCDPNGQYDSIKESIRDWYLEACPSSSQGAYDFKNQPGAGYVYHFTQVVWAESTQLGCGSALGENAGMKCMFYACRYKKKGNMGGSYAENVKKGDFDVAETCANINGVLHLSGTNAGVVPNQEVATKPPIVVSPKEVATGANIGAVTTGTDGMPLDAVSQLGKDEAVYQDDCLKVINRFRKIHLSPEIVGDSILHASAFKIAESLVEDEKSRDKMKEKLKNQKEGLYQISCTPDNKVLPPEEAMANWYREVCFKLDDFDFSTQESLAKAPHFTQLVWRKSKKIGVAYATKLKPKSQTLCTVVVAKFDPVGNTGDFTSNVDKGSFERSFCGTINC